MLGLAKQTPEPRSVELVERSRPEPASDEALVEVGDAVSRFGVGDRVVERPIRNCGTCHQCEIGETNVCGNAVITEYEDFERALRLVERGIVDCETFLDDRFSLRSAPEAFEAFLAGETCKPVFDVAELRE